MDGIDTPTTAREFNRNLIAANAGDEFSAWSGENAPELFPSEEARGAWLGAQVSVGSTPFSAAAQPPISQEEARPHFRTRAKRAQVVIDPSARPFLTSRIEPVVDWLLNRLEYAALRYNIQVSKVEVSGSTDRDEGTQQIVITQWVSVPPRIALSYWDKLGALMQAWTSKQSADVVSLLLERIAVEVSWEHDSEI